MLALTGGARRWEPKRLRLAGQWPWDPLITTAIPRPPDVTAGKPGTAAS
jgi:hypothetical protein